MVHEEQEEAKCMSEKQTLSKQQLKQVTLQASLERLQVYGKESLRLKTTDEEALVRMLATDLQPGTIVEDHGFLNFLCHSPKVPAS